MNRPHDPKTLRLQEATYRRLLLLYPAAFRRSHGELMIQLFRDQCREACRGRSGWRLLAFWGWILADTAMAAGREHLCAIGRKMKMNTLECWYRRLPTFRQTFASIVIIGLTLTILRVTLPPTLYSSRVRIATTDSIGTGSQIFQTESEMRASERFIQLLISEQVLQSVATELNLEWTRANHSRSVKPEETLAALRRRVEVRRFRDTSLLEVWVFDEDRDKAAAIANMIADTYGQAARVPDKPSLIEVVDRAEPGLKPVRPNKPMIWVLGVFSTFLAATGLALLRKLVQPWVRSRPVRIAPA